jgi:ankyrin repeat protein
LHKAVYQDDIKKLAKLLREETETDPNQKDTHGNTPLHLAVMLGHTGFSVDGWREQDEIELINVFQNFEKTYGD